MSFFRPKSLETAVNFIHSLAASPRTARERKQIEFALESIRCHEKEENRESIIFDVPDDIRKLGFRSRDERRLMKAPATLIAESLAALSLERCGVEDVHREAFRLYVTTWVIPSLVEAYRKLQKRDGKKGGAR